MTTPAGDQGGLGGLRDFREEFYAALSGWGDTLFELCDAALCAPGPISSVPALSLEPVFRRSHGSLYKALAKGEIDTEKLRGLLVARRPERWPLVFAVDASTWDRCDAECSPERGFYYSASKHSAGQPIVAGWSYQWICQLSWAPDSWTAPLDVMRVTPLVDATSATIAQIRRLVGLLPSDGEIPLFVFDAGYDPIALAHDLAEVRAETLTRIRDDRVFYTDPPDRPNGPVHTIGRPPRHGKRFECADGRTWGTPDDCLVATDARYGTVKVQAWHGLHPKLLRRGRWVHYDLPPIVRGTVIRVDVEHLPKTTSRSKKTLWLFWSVPMRPWRGHHEDVKIGSGSPVTPSFPWPLRPLVSLALGPDLEGSLIVLRARGSEFRFPTEPPGLPSRHCATRRMRWATT